MCTQLAPAKHSGNKKPAWDAEYFPGLLPTVFSSTPRKLEIHLGSSPTCHQVFFVWGDTSSSLEAVVSDTPKAPIEVEP
jgi:hypothetical protein